MSVIETNLGEFWLYPKRFKQKRPFCYFFCYSQMDTQLRRRIEDRNVLELFKYLKEVYCDDAECGLQYTIHV